LARYTQSVCRFCRREGEKLFLKGNRCLSDKCAFARRGYPPGQHGQKHPRLSNYGVQLREKQKVKRIYGLLEQQFKINFKRAERIKGVTGENLMVLLERRLDNVVYKSGFSLSTKQARQLVNHGHFYVNGKKVDIPSYLLKPGDVVSASDKAREMVPIKAAVEAGREIPVWLKVDPTKVVSEVISMPTRESIKLPINEQLIVEFFSK
jgi:small subunit ribosomal protein S4